MQKSDDILASPVKFSVKRRAAVLDLTDSDGEGSATGDTPSKRSRGAASIGGAAGSGSGVGASGSATGVTPSKGSRGAASTGGAADSGSVTSGGATGVTPSKG